MISYPGEILARFGRYEAVEDLGRAERAHIWKAWDPFLERFVTVAALPGINPAELYKEVPDLSTALSRWLRGWYRDGRRVLDFGPSSPLAPAYFVFELVEEEPIATAPSAGEKPEARVPASVAPAAKQSPAAWTALLTSVAGLVVGLVAGSLLTQRSHDNTVGPPQRSAEPPAATSLASAPALTVAAPATRPTPLSPTGVVTVTAVAPTRTVAIAATVAIPPTRALAIPSLPPALTLRVKPEAGVISLASGGRREFIAETSGGTPKTYRWDLGGKAVGAESRYRFTSAFLDEASGQTLTLTVADQQSGETAQKQWTLVVEPRNAAPTVAIRIPREPAVPGTIVVIGGNVSDPDLDRGDRITCTWEIDQVATGSSCRRLEWLVPTSLSSGTATVVLTVRDARGATATDEATLTIQAPPTVAPAPPPEALATPSTAAAQQEPEPAPATVVEEAPPAATATAAISAADEEQAIRAAVAAFAVKYQVTLRTRRGLEEATARFEVLAVDGKGESATVTVARVVEIRGEGAQTAEKVYKLRKTDGNWSVVE